MFNWKKEEKPKRPSGRNLSQFGLFDIPGDFDNGVDNLNDGNDNDEDLEAELAALTSGSGVPKQQPKKPPPLVSPSNLDRMIADSLRDIPSDEDVSEDESDPQLLAELAEISGNATASVVSSPVSDGNQETNDILTVLNERLKMYQTAEENAKKSGESSRARRLGRGIKTLNELIKYAKAGRDINKDDIPPEVAVTVTKKDPPQPNPPDSSNQICTSMGVSDDIQDLPSPDDSTNKEKEHVLNLLNERKKEYKLAALRAKKEDNGELAVKYIKIAKQFDVVIAAVENDQPVDLSKMPGPPSQQTAARSNKEECEKQTSGSDPTDIPVNPPPTISADDDEGEAPALISASSVGEALQQRLEKYKSEEQKAKDAGNSSKARRMGRIVKQFEDAIRLHRAGKPVPFDELPTPPGFGPIPIPNAQSEPPPPVPRRTAPPVPPSSDDNEEGAAAAVPPSPPKRNTSRKSGNQSSTTVNERQMQLLLSRQKEFKLAALNAKKKGEIEEAKEYLKMAKGLDKLIEASQCGLPVDMSSIPIPAKARSELEDSFDIVMAAECNDDDGELSDILGRMEEQLTKQLKMCFNTRDHLKAIGDIAGMNRFENLALNVTRDLDAVRLARRTDVDTPPKFHYETKNFSIVKSFTDLNDDELELTIVRGINYKCSNPDDIDTYVKFDFPYPQEETFKERTAVVKNTNNPEYNATFKIPIQRNVRACQRVFKRHGVKFEIYSKGCLLLNDWCSLFDCCSGFFRSDTLLGTVNIKLQPLETKVEIHDSYDLMDGRKQVGGKLEIRMRLRNPLLTRQIEELSEKWLVIDV